VIHKVSQLSLLFGTVFVLSGCPSNTQQQGSGSPSAPSNPSAPTASTPSSSTVGGTISTDFPNLPSVPSGSASNDSGSQASKGKASGNSGSKESKDDLDDLDKTLDDSLDTFEDTVARQKGKAAEGDVYSSTAEGRSGSGDAPLFEDLENSDWEAAANAENRDKDEQDSSDTSENKSSGKSAGKNTPSGAVPDDIDDGQDDDIVARQLREAAMNEQDPALREKLWEEYRRYKKK